MDIQIDPADWRRVYSEAENGSFRRDNAETRASEPSRPSQSNIVNYADVLGALNLERGDGGEHEQEARHERHPGRQQRARRDGYGEGNPDANREQGFVPKLEITAEFLDLIVILLLTLSVLQFSDPTLCKFATRNTQKCDRKLPSN